MLKNAENELYPGCKKYSQLSAIIRLFHIKCLNRVSNKGFTDLLEFIKDAFLVGETFPKSYYEAKKMIGGLGLSYNKIHACPNDCMLYRKEYENDTECHVCKTSRYLEYKDSDALGEALSKRKKVPAKVLRHFPLIPRLQRLFMSSKTASFMRWHKEGRTEDGYMRHPADSPAWKTFNFRYRDFAEETRNIRLGLTSNGFNPFRSLNDHYSTWHVVLIAYNLSPWMCMKQEYFFSFVIDSWPNNAREQSGCILRALDRGVKIVVGGWGKYL